ncbi:MAG: hypothetical protein OIF51_00090, partial [Cellvibrionaceae bacterium]|nr:hypothetical protein [Cellvibrionaceae bacterium]
HMLEKRRSTSTTQHQGINATVPVRGLLLTRLFLWQSSRSSTSVMNASLAYFGIPLLSVGSLFPEINFTTPFVLVMAASSEVTANSNALILSAAERSEW